MARVILQGQSVQNTGIILKINVKGLYQLIQVISYDVVRTYKLYSNCSRSSLLIQPNIILIFKFYSDIQILFLVFLL